MAIARVMLSSVVRTSDTRAQKIPYYFIAGLFCVLSCLCASPIVRANEVNLTLKNVGSIIDNNTYVGPYTAQITGSSSIQVICDNYNTVVHVGLNWNATTITFADPKFAQDVKFSDTSSNPNVPKHGTPPSAGTVLQDYEAAAWLAQQIMADYNRITPGSKSALYEQIGDLQYALLAIFSSSAKSSRGFDTDAYNYYYQALHPNTPYTLSQFSNVEFWTPDPLGASQEYITITPEPASLLLFGTGILGIGFIVRRRP